MQKISPPLLIGGGVLLAVLAVTWLTRKGSAASIGTAAADAVGGAVSGAAVGVGSWFGIPATDPAKGQAAVASGDLLGASMYLPAGQFVGSIPQTAVNAANNPSINPLQPLGASIGSTIYDWLHPGAQTATTGATTNGGLPVY